MIEESNNIPPNSLNFVPKFFVLLYLLFFVTWLLIILSTWEWMCLIKLNVIG